VSARRAVPLWRKLLPLIGIGVLAWVLHRLDLSRMGSVLGRVPATTIALSGACFAVNLWLKVWRWQRLLAAQGIALPHRVVLAAFLSAQFYAQVTVGRVGEFLRIEALTERGVRPGVALSSCIFDRLLDVYLVLSAAAVLGALVVGDQRAAIAAASVLALATVAGAAALFWLERLGERDPSAPLFSGVRLISRLARGLRDLARATLPLLRPAPLLEAAGWTLIAWCFYFGALVVLADGLAIAVPRALLAATAALAALSALLPVTISGLGARELIYVEVLRVQGVASERAVALSLLHLAVMSALAIGLGLLGVAWRARQRTVSPIVP
jgi:uncharacterized membrane protein YbhN (UPF0104 family)